MLKKILLAVALALPMFVSAQTVKIGLVDTQSIMTAMPETTAAQNQVQEASKKYDEEYTKLGEEMKRMYEELQNMKDDVLPAIKERKTRDFTDYQQKIQQFEQNAVQDLQKLQNDLMAPIMQKLRSAIESVGKEAGYSLILPVETALYYGAPTEDITSLVKTKLGVK